MHISNKNSPKNLGGGAICRGILPKKLISAMLMLALLCSSLAIPTEFHLTASADTGTWSDCIGKGNEKTYTYADFTPFADTNKGGSNAPYEIGSPAQLAALAILVNNTGDVTGYEYDENGSIKDDDNSKITATCRNFQNTFIKLTASFSLGAHEWVPIGLGNNGVVDYSGIKKPPTNVFKGNFDGQGHEIKNMRIGGNPSENGTAATYEYAGLFGYVQADAEEKPVTIQNVNIGENSWVYSKNTNGSTYAGGICAYAYAIADGKTDNDSATITISNCSNSGTITAFSSSSSSFADAGGICAYASATITISNCSNSGTITAFSSSHYYYAGGICAYARATDVTITITISNCSNSGTIEAKTSSAASYAGGICAYAAATITIKDCNNSANITAYAADSYAGGICAAANVSATISNCSNSGSVTATSTSGNAKAGGICAEAYATISNCSNSGTIEAKTSSAASYAGGICTQTYATINNCSNSGSVTATSTSGTAYAGGICDQAYATINNCSNSGSVTATSTSGNAKAGGICAEAYADADAMLTISNCYYLNSSTNNGGVGITTGSVTKTITALPEEQMKAAAGSSGDTWKPITVKDTEGNTLSEYNEKAVPLVDALNAGADSYNSDLNNTVKALNWVNGKNNGGYPVHLLFRARTTLGYPLREITFENRADEINLPNLGVLEDVKDAEDDTDNDSNGVTDNQITAISQLKWVNGSENSYDVDNSGEVSEKNLENIKSKWPGNNGTLLLTAKYEVDGKPVGDEIDNKHIVEVVDDGTLYVGVFETTDIEGVTESDKVVGIQPKDTNKFLCWVGNVDNDEDLEVLSYRDTYYFYARTDRTIIAVYEKDTIAQSIAALEGQNADSIDVCANIESVDTVKNDDGTTAGFRVVSMCSVPHTQEKENYIIDWAGILATKNKDIGIGKSDINFESSLTGRSGTIEGANSDVMVRGHDSEANNTQFTWIRKPNGNETWYVRAYLVYRKNAEATQQYKHGEIFKIEFNNDTVNWTSVPEGGSN